MRALIWIGSLLALLGIGLLLWCILRVVRARRAGLDDAAFKAEMSRIVAWNMAALGISGLGLMAVVVGVILS